MYHTCCFDTVYTLKHQLLSIQRVIDDMSLLNGPDNVPKDYLTLSACSVNCAPL